MLGLLGSFLDVQQVVCPMSCNILLMHLDSLHKLKAFVAAQAKTEIAQEVKEALQKSMESFGFIIIETLVGGPPCRLLHRCWLLSTAEGSFWLSSASSPLPQSQYHTTTTQSSSSSLQ